LKHLKIFEDFITNEINYSLPNFEYEWEEAARYPEFVKMGKDEWLEKASDGYSTNYSKIKEILGNVDLDFDSLEEPKKERFKKAFQFKTIEMPIVVKFSEEDYDLVAGNTRLSGLIKAGLDPKIWIVDISNLNIN
jgi:hypothetical protein